MTADEHYPSHQCPSCGQFVGPYDRCPYCGADAGRRMAVRILKYGSLLLALLGLAVLLLVARHSQVPAVDIGSLAGTMNWAYIRIAGQVSRQPAYDPQARNLQFWVWDGTGEIMVSAYRSEAETLLAENRVPVMGDAVAVEGTLRVREDFQYLVLNVPDRVEIRPVVPVEMAIAQVNGAPLYQKVTVTGVVRADRTPYEGLRILTLRDASGQIDVTLPSAVAAPGSTFPAVAVGQVVQVTGAVDHYQGTPQVSLGRASDLLLVDEALAIAPSRRIGELSTGDIGSLDAVEGTISRISAFSAGVKCLLDDGSGTATLLLWQDLYDALPERDALARGATVRAVGQVSEYQGELEIIPELPSDVSIVAMSGATPATPTPVPSPTWQPAPEPTPGPLETAPPAATDTAMDLPTATPPPAPSPTPRPATPPTPTVETRTIAAIGSGDVGRPFTIARAGIANLTYFSRGIRYTLTDPTGSIVLLLWQDLLEEVPDRYDLFPGSQVKITGEIDEYQGELEIMPRRAADVAVVSHGERAPIEQRMADNITPSDEGRIFVVQGTVARTDSRQWLKLWLDDGTGQILIYVPERAVAYLPAGVGPGARLRVTGEVDIYQGEIEIIPLAGVDVEVR
jgi:DNA/RNA endonuclease YhcR with UshA esterase domain